MPNKPVWVVQTWGEVGDFFLGKGLVHCEFVPYNQTVNKEFYMEVLRRLRDAVCRKRAELWKIRVRCCSCITPYLQLSVKSPDSCLALPATLSRRGPSNFFLFPKMKATFKECCSQTINDTKKNTIWQVFAIHKNTFQETLQKWKKHWERYSANRGDFFEWDKPVQNCNYINKVIITKVFFFWAHLVHEIIKLFIKT